MKGIMLAKIFDVASYLQHLSDKKNSVITNMKMQKLLYYAQGWHLALYDAPLFIDDFEAWKYGPVIGEVYRKYDSLQSTTAPDIDSLPYEQKRFIRSVYRKYGLHDSYTLSNMTHNELPWKKCYKEDENKIIPKDELREFFLKLHEKRLKDAKNLPLSEYIKMSFNDYDELYKLLEK
jgi:uncharacterized phage-associated protein